MGSTRVHGVLSVARIRGRPAFTAEDLEMAAGFANQAAVAIELAEARAEQQRAAMLDERERIAADLHDHVIQRLFAAGLSLQALAGTLGPGRAGRPDPGHDRRPRRHHRPDPHQHLRAAAEPPDPAARPAGPPARRGHRGDPGARVRPGACGSPGCSTRLPDDVAEDLLAVLREALTNIARHAHAHTAEVDLTADAEWLTLDIRDDGIGLGATTRRSGLANLRRRAEHHGGTLTLAPRDPTGTWLSWSIPNN